MPLRDASHSTAVRNALIAAWNAANIPGRSDRERARLLHVVVVGGGPTGELWGRRRCLVKCLVQRRGEVPGAVQPAWYSTGWGAARSAQRAAQGACSTGCRAGCRAGCSTRCSLAPAANCTAPTALHRRARQLAASLSPRYRRRRGGRRDFRPNQSRPPSNRPDPGARHAGARNQPQPGAARASTAAPRWPARLRRRLLEDWAITRTPGPPLPLPLLAPGR
jgi:hypothetical protein